MKVIDHVPSEVAAWAADEFIDYFKHFTTIEDYLRHVKQEVLQKPISLFSMKDEFFNEDIHPDEMDFEVIFVGDRFNSALSQDYYRSRLTATSSHNIEDNIPERPNGLVVVRIDSKSGKLSSVGNPSSVFEVFRESNVPTRARESDYSSSEEDGQKEAIKPEQIF